MATQAELLVEIKQAPESDAPRRRFADLLLANHHPRGRWMHAQLDAADPSLPRDARELAAAQADAEFVVALTRSDQRARDDLSRARASTWTQIRPPDLGLGECAMRLLVTTARQPTQPVAAFALRYTRGMLTDLHVELGSEHEVRQVASVLARAPMNRFGCPGSLLDSYRCEGALRDLHELRVDGRVEVEALIQARWAAPNLRRIDSRHATLVGPRAPLDAACVGLEVAWPDPLDDPLEDPPERPFARFEATMAEVLAEEQRCDAYDSSWSENPYSPWQVAVGLTVEAAVPYLIATLESADTRERTWARYALQQLGPAAGPEAGAALERLGHHEALFHVDEARARALRIDRTRPHRQTIATRIADRGPTAMREHFEALLANPDPDVVAFALGSGPYGDDSGMTKAARNSPEQVPIVRVRALLDADDRAVRDRVVNVLASLHLPEDAGPVLERLIAGVAAVQGRAASWLGSHPRSDEWLARVTDLGEVHEIVRRRRCAGLTTSPERVRVRVLAALQAEAAVPGYDDARKRASGHAAEIVGELRDPSFAAALVDAIGPVPGARAREGEGPFDAIEAALLSLGEAGRAAVDTATFVDPTRQQKLGWMRDALLRPPRWPPSTLEHADAQFIDGELETGSGGGAFAIYAKWLLADPRSAHAAAQIAWIDRGLGVWISPQRIAWLRDLGVADPLVTEIATRPPAILFGFGFGHPRLMAPDRVRVHADTALQAGLFGIAARYYGDRWPDEAVQAREAARTHLERSRARPREA